MVTSILHFITLGACNWPDGLLLFSSRCKRKNRTDITKRKCLSGEHIFLPPLTGEGLFILFTLEGLPEKHIRPVCHCVDEYSCRCVRGRGTYWCVMATATEPSTLSALAYQQYPRAGSSAANAALVRVLSHSLSFFNTIIKTNSLC